MPHSGSTRLRGFIKIKLVLIKATVLPPKISFSPIEVPLWGDSGNKLTLPRRDLFDARFQLIADDSLAPVEEDINAFVDAPSDLVPGVYEGGLKTWECSLDLIAYLQREGLGSAWLDGKTILEVRFGFHVIRCYVG